MEPEVLLSAPVPFFKCLNYTITAEHYKEIKSSALITMFFMSKIHEMIAVAVLPIIKGVGKLEMQNVILCSKENNPPGIYENILQGLHSNFCLLKEAAVKTKSNFDDGIVDLILEAVKESADQDGIILS